MAYLSSRWGGEYCAVSPGNGLRMAAWLPHVTSFVLVFHFTPICKRARPGLKAVDEPVVAVAPRRFIEQFYEFKQLGCGTACGLRVDVDSKVLPIDRAVLLHVLVCDFHRLSPWPSGHSLRAPQLVAVEPGSSAVVDRRRGFVYNDSG